VKQIVSSRHLRSDACKRNNRYGVVQGQAESLGDLPGGRIGRAKLALAEPIEQVRMMVAQ
jgi:hypothetical protein